jgi:small nuclear ribonucleoprotein G
VCCCFLPVQLNGTRKVVGTLRGYDQFMNVVLENAIEDRGAQGKFSIPDMLVRRQ